MATMADSSSNRDGVSSPQLRRNNLTSPWAQVVRGEPESMSLARQSPSSPPSSSSSPPVDSAPEQTPFSDCSPTKAASSSPPPIENCVAAEGSDSNGNNAAGRLKKPAWNKPSNGVLEVGPVMGASSWPALSESARASPKSLADSSPKTVSDGSVSTSQVPVVPQSVQKQAITNVNPNSTSNRTMPGRQRPSKRGGSGVGNNPGGGPVQSGFIHPRPPPPPPPPPFPVLQMPPNSYGGFVPAMPDPSLREPQYRPVGGFVSQPHMVNDHRHSSRRGNYGPRGDGGYQNNFGVRRDQDRGNYGNARDVHMQSQRGPRGFMRPPPPTPHTFVPPQPVRPFANPIGYPDLIYFPTMPLEPFRGVPFIAPAPPPAMILPSPELSLPAMLVHQIDYYFSDANLVKDDFLKSNMDDQGWVPISLIAGFPRVKSLTTNIQLILDSLRNSSIVEVQDDKVRRRNEWMKWIPSSGRVVTESGLPSPTGSSSEMLAPSFQNITIEEAANPSNKAYSEDTSGRHASDLLSQ